jgi:hypothetical protein
MAQAAMGAPTPQGGAPIAQQIMAQAQEPTGVDALPSNLPQSYAPGGLVAFEEGGKVERYQNQGLIEPDWAFRGYPQRGAERYSNMPSDTPVRRGMARLFGSMLDTQEDAALRSALAQRFGRSASVFPGAFIKQTDEERELAKQAMGLIHQLPPEKLRVLDKEGLAAVPGLAASLVTAATPAAATPAATTPAAATPAAAAAAPAAAAPERTPFTPFAMPALKLATYNAPALPAGTDLDAIVADAPAKAKVAFDQARDAEEKALRAMTEPGESAREARFTAREAALARDSAIGRALNIMGVGFGIAGSKERTLAGALGNEGRQGIQALIQGEAANRVAKERLEDARDNFEQQKIAAKKGDRTAANAAGQRAADDYRAYTQLTLQAATAKNADAVQRYNAQQQAEQFRVGEQNRSALGLAGLNVNLAQLNQTGAYQNALLAQNDKRIAASNRATQARESQVRATALDKFDKGPGMQLNMQLAKQYGENWRTGTDARSLQAQMLYRQQRQAYLIDALDNAGLMLEMGGARSADALLGGSE